MFDKLNNIVQIKEYEILVSHTTFNIGGPARYYCQCNDENKLIKLINLAEKNSLPYFFIGSGSNVLISDEGFDGLVINLNSNKLKVIDNIIYCDAGVLLSKLVGQALAVNLSGLEWAVGIPGTVGGAVRGNVGAYGGEMKDNILEVKILRRNKPRMLKNRDCKFGYRDSIFKHNNDVILSVKVELKKMDSKLIKDKMDNNLRLRKDKFSDGYNIGSIFKNVFFDNDVKIENLPDDFIKNKMIPSAWLIDQCDLKGKQVGGAKISENHAGVIINVKEANAIDVVELINLIKKNVFNKFKIKLEEEIVYLGF